LKVTGELVGGKDVAPILCDFIAQRTKQPAFVGANALGILRGERIVVAVAYNNFHWPDICMHVASDPGAVWASNDFLYHAFAYPFLQLQCKRVTGLVARKNKASRALCEKLGFKLEGTMKDALPVDDLMIYGLLRGNCRYIVQDERKAA
jgi:hypothetical protein